MAGAEKNGRYYTLYYMGAKNSRHRWRVVCSFVPYLPGDDDVPNYYFYTHTHTTGRVLSRTKICYLVYYIILYGMCNTTSKMISIVNDLWRGVFFFSFFVFFFIFLLLAGRTSTCFISRRHVYIISHRCRFALDVFTIIINKIYRTRGIHDSR